VPLLVVGGSIIPDEKNKLFNHLDLPNIIYHYAAADQHPDFRREMFFVGTTEKWVYGKMNKGKKHLFIDDASGTILSKDGELNPIKIRNKFQNYLDIFNVKYGKK
jgi:hypothetical protein